RGQKDLKSQADSNDNAVRSLSGALESAKQSLAGLSTALKQADQDQTARNAEQVADLQKHLARLDEGQSQAAKTSASLATALDQAREGHSQSIAKLGDALSRLQTGVDANLAKEVDLSSVRSEVAGVRELAQSLQKEQAALSQVLGEVAAKEVD